MQAPLSPRSTAQLRPKLEELSSAQLQAHTSSSDDRLSVKMQAPLSPRSTAQLRSKIEELPSAQLQSLVLAACINGAADGEELRDRVHSAHSRRSRSQHSHSHSHSHSSRSTRSHRRSSSSSSSSSSSPSPSPSPRPRARAIINFDNYGREVYRLLNKRHADQYPRSRTAQARLARDAADQIDAALAAIVAQTSARRAAFETKKSAAETIRRILKSVCVAKGPLAADVRRVAGGWGWDERLLEALGKFTPDELERLRDWDDGRGKWGAKLHDLAVMAEDMFDYMDYAFGILDTGAGEEEDEGYAGDGQDDGDDDDDDDEGDGLDGYWGEPSVF